MATSTPNDPLSIVPKCNITDEFILELKDAELHRTIIYENSTGSEFPISLDRKEFIYPYQCEDFRVVINGAELDKDKWDISPRGYVQKLVIKVPTIQLTNTLKVEVKIITRWREFYNFVTDFHYNFQFDDIANYQLIFRNFSLANTLHILKINDKEAVKDRDYTITDNSVKLNGVQVGPSDIFSIKLFSLSTPIDLGILEYNKTSNNTLFSNLCIIVIQHLLSDSVHLIEAFHQGGAPKNDIFIVGIPYSTKHPTVKYLRHNGYNNIWTPTEYQFLEKDVKQAIEQALSQCELNGSKKILVVEDGGYVVPLIHKEYIDKANKIIGAVEQTANGIWRDRKIYENDNIQLQFPIINVAESTIKLQLESPLIGRAVSKNIEIVYNKSYRGVAGVKIGIIGFGSTGSQVAQTLKNMGAAIMVFDKRTDNMTDAENKGFVVGESLIDVIKNNEILVEATGDYWTTSESEMRDIIFSFKHGSYFVSASSKRMGLNHQELEKLIHKSRTVNIPGVGVRYKLRNSTECDLTLIADGYPVNFFLGESVPDRDIAFILAWLYKSATILVEMHQKFPKEIIDANSTDDKWGLLKGQADISDLHSRRMI